MRSALAAALVVVPFSVGGAHAGTSDTDDTSPRAIGRAGATIVSDDADGALAVSPASLARRSDDRIRLGVIVRDRDVDFRAADGVPLVGDRASPTVSPAIALVKHVGPVVIAASYHEPIAYRVRLPSPAFGQPAADVARLFPHRYSGLELATRARELRVGGALRASDWLAVGVSASMQRRTVRDSRVLWPGFTGRDGLANPIRDVSLDLDASASLVPGAAGGVLVAPAALPVEFALAVIWRRGARAEGIAVASPLQPASPSIDGSSARAAVDLPMEITVSAGLRAAMAPMAVEIGSLWRIHDGDGAPPAWRLSGLEFTDESGVSAALDSVPAQWAPRSHASAMASVEAEVLAGFLWLTGGYRYEQAASSKPYLSATHADMARHTGALGVEVYVGGMTAVIGYSRSMARELSQERSALELINPFAGGTAPTGNGRYDRADDRFGISFEVSWSQLPTL